MVKERKKGLCLLAVGSRTVQGLPPLHAVCPSKSDQRNGVPSDLKDQEASSTRPPYLKPLNPGAGRKPGGQAGQGISGLGQGLGLTELVAVLGGGGDATPGDLHVLAAGPAVELVLTDLPPAQLVGHGALVPHVLVKIRRRVILPLCGYQGKNSVNLLWVTPPLVHLGRGVKR